MQNFAIGTVGDDGEHEEQAEGFEEDAKMIVTEKNEEQVGNLPIKMGNASNGEQPPRGTVYETTLAQIFRSRSSLLWGPDSENSQEETEYDNQTTTTTTIATITTTTTKSNGSRSSRDNKNDNDVGSSLEVFKSSKKIPSILTRSESDLDRGRYLVGLEVREVEAHQQMIVDYVQTSSTEEMSANHNVNGQPKPIRIKYVLSESAYYNETSGASNENNGDIKQNQSLLLTKLLSTSFARAAKIWSNALSLPPAMDRLFPTVEMCGSARVPSSDRENGVEAADVLIYVSGEGKHCGGAVMHSAVCDFDQVCYIIFGLVLVIARQVLLCHFCDIVDLSFRHFFPAH